MEVRSDACQLRNDKIPSPSLPRTRLQVWFIRVCSGILVWTCFIQLVTVGELWHPHLLKGLSNQITWIAHFKLHLEEAAPDPPPLVPASEYFFIYNIF